ncbi:ribbon-helix-helix domain-containing protein [Streptomyces olivoreticuli]
MTTEPKNSVKTLGIKLPDDLHAQFALVAQLNGLNLTDAIRAAVELYVTHHQTEADFTARAAQALEEIEREAAARRNAIQALFGNSSPGSTAAEGEAKSAGRRKGEAGA